MYVFDTNVFIALGFYFPSRFPTIWDKISMLIEHGDLISVREVKRELDLYCPSQHIIEWLDANRKIFTKPTVEELKIVADILREPRFRGLVRKKKILDGKPVADPFVIAAAKYHGFTVVTEESFKQSGARIPTVCDELGVDCVNIEEFLTREKVKY